MYQYHASISINISMYMYYYYSEDIADRCRTLKHKLEMLGQQAELRRAKLTDNSAFLQFMWKSDVVESWIGKVLSNLLCRVCEANFDALGFLNGSFFWFEVSEKPFFVENIIKFLRFLIFPCQFSLFLKIEIMSHTCR